MAIKEYLIKNNCICGGNLKNNIKLDKQPLINVFKSVKTKKFPTIISQCSRCYLVQLKYSIKDKLIFPNDYSYLSGDSKEKIEDYKDLISKISLKYKQKKSKILDIGGNDGSLSQIAKKKGFYVINIEPTNVYKLSIKKGVKTIKKKFGLNVANDFTKKGVKFDFIVSTNFFAHTNNLVSILKGTKKILKKNGLLIVEIQYLYKVLKANGFDSFHQDHKYYYTLNSIKKIFNIFDLNVFDAEFLKYQPEILRVYVDHNKRKKTQRCLNLLNNEKDSSISKKIKKLNNFRIRHISKLKLLIKKLIKQNKKIYGISASPRGCVLLNSAGLNQNTINMVGEMNGSFKLKKFIPGTDIKIEDENKIIIDQPNFVIILAWHLKKRLIKSLKKKGFKGKFIVPLPKIKIL